MGADNTALIQAKARALAGALEFTAQQNARGALARASATPRRPPSR